MQRSEPTPSTRPNTVLYLSVVTLAVAASASSLGNGFALDDLALVADNPRVHSLHAWWRLFALPYWPPQFGASLYRPVVTLAFALQWAVHGGAPWVFHLTSVVLYAGTSALVLALFLLVLPRTPAFIAAAFFAVHPVHVEAVGNVVGQSELLAALAMLAASVIYLRARRSGALTAGVTCGIALLFAIACLAKEHALLLPAILVALETFAVERDAESSGEIHREPVAGFGRVRSVARELAPTYLALAVVAAAYVSVRITVLNSLLGEQPLVPMHGWTRLWALLVVAPHWARLLFWPAHLSAEYSPQHIRIPEAPGLGIVPGIAIVVAAVLVFIALGRGGRRTSTTALAGRLALAWMAVALLPVSNLFSALVIAERTLFLPSVGAMLALGAVAAGVLDALERRRRSVPGRLLVTVAASLVIVAGTLRSSARQRVWRDDATLFAQMVEDAPLSYRAQFFYGQLLFDRGQRAEGERRVLLAIRLNPTPSDVSPLNYLATVYRDAGMCAQALPLYERAIANGPDRPDVRYGLATCLLEMGRVEEARRLAEEGVRRRALRSLFVRLAARIDTALANAR